MAHAPDICIRGGGIVGRALALLLAREKLRVALVVPARRAGGVNDAGHADVRAYALNAAARHLLEGLRAWPDAHHATPVTEMQVWGDLDGFVRFGAAEQGAEALNWIVDVPALEARLAEAVRFQPDIEVVETPVDAPLTVVCEGRASATRAELGVEYAVQPYPQHALATRVACERPHGQVARQWFTQEDILAFLPLGGAAGHEAAVVWSQPPARAAERAALSAPELAAELAAASQGALGALEVTHPAAVWPLQIARATRWVGGMPGAPGRSWVLAGDAAHTVHPLAGQGLNLGLADAVELARVLGAREAWRSPADRKPLRAYERARQADTLAMGWVTDGLQQLFGRAEPPLAWLRNRGMRGFDAAGPLKHWLAARAMGR